MTCSNARLHEYAAVISRCENALTCSTCCLLAMPRRLLTSPCRRFVICRDLIAVTDHISAGVPHNNPPFPITSSLPSDARQRFSRQSISIWMWLYLEVDRHVFPEPPSWSRSSPSTFDWPQTCSKAQVERCDEGLVTALDHAAISTSNDKHLATARRKAATADSALLGFSRLDGPDAGTGVARERGRVSLRVPDVANETLEHSVCSLETSVTTVTATARSRQGGLHDEPKRSTIGNQQKGVCGKGMKGNIHTVPTGLDF